MTPRKLLSHRAIRFALIGVGSTVLNLVLFALLTQAMSNQVANIGSLVICTVLNTAANRHFTFEVRGRAGHARVQLQSLGLLAITWAATAGALAVLEHLRPDSSTLVATVTVAIGNLLATVVRFFLLSHWLSEPSTTLIEPVHVD